VQDPAVRYFQETAPHTGLLLALIADICFLAVVVFGFALLSTFENKPAKRIGVAGLIAAGIVGFYQVQRFISESLEQWKAGESWRVAKIALICLFVLLAVRFRRRTRPFIAGVLLILSPAFIVLALNGLWRYRTVDLPRVADASHARMIAGTRSRAHLVWIVFDELDARMLFAARPQRIELPQFDRLRAEALYGTRTRAPSTDTLWSMPAFILAKKVVRVDLDTRKLGVSFQSHGRFIDAASLPNVFREARAGGLNTGLTGWHHPYCLIFGSDLSDCSWMSFGGQAVRVEKLLRGRSFVEGAWYLFDWQARYSVPRIIEPLHWVAAEPEESTMWRKEQTEAMQFIVGNSLRMLRNPDLNFLFLHIPTPHPAGIWNSRNGRFTLENSDYVDNLALADKTMGDIRKLMEQLGTWDASTVLVTSDHPYRTGMWMDSSIWTEEMARITQGRIQPYVPFFLKLPGQHAGIEYTMEFNNVLSGDLALAILEGRLKRQEEAASWLSINARASLQ
jgi:hypothetical protein